MNTSSPDHKMAVAFARILRGAGIDVPLDSVIVFVSALSKIGLENRDDVYWAAYATLIRRHEDSPIFDRAFAIFWDQLIAVDTATYEQQTESVTLLIDSEDTNNDDSNAAPVDEEENTLTLRFSSIETLREKDFAAYSETELREAVNSMVLTEEQWGHISHDQKLTEEFIREYKKELHWGEISYTQKLPEELIREMQNEVDWYGISSCQVLSEEFIEEFKDQLELEELCSNAVHNCGEHNRTIFIQKKNTNVIHIGCYSGTKEEVIQAVQEKYGLNSEYEKQIHECFNF